MTFDALLALLDGFFATAACICLAIARFAPLRAYQRLIREIDALGAARLQAKESPSLRQLANAARLMEVIPRAAAAVGENRAPSVTAVVKGRRGRLDLVNNFFVRSPAIQTRVDQYLAELRTACIDRRRQAAYGYASPFNPFNLPSTLACYLGLTLPPRGAILLDAVAWLSTAAVAGAVALHV